MGLFRRGKEEKPVEHDLPHGESKDLFGIVLTNACKAPLKVKVYPQKVIVISEMEEQ